MPTNYQKVLILNAIEYSLQRYIITEFMKYSITNEEVEFPYEYDYIQYCNTIKQMSEMVEKERKIQVPRFVSMIGIKKSQFIKLRDKNEKIIFEKLMNKKERDIDECFDYFNDCLIKIENILKESMELCKN